VVNLRDYQIECLRTIKQRRDEGITRQLVALPTGTGKTTIFANLPETLSQNKMLVLAHREELLDQAQEKLKTFNPDLDVQIEQADRHASPRADIVIASTATIGRKDCPRIQAFNPDDWPVLICDEAHHSVATTYTNIFDHFGIFQDPNKLLVGWTATPRRGDSIGLDAVFQDVVFHRDIREMIESGWLCSITGYRIKTDADISGVHTHSGDFAEGELSLAVDIESRNKLAVESYKTYCAGRRALVFCVNKEHTNHMAEAFNKAGIECGIVLGDTPSEERADTLLRLRQGTIKVVANCMVLTEGFDLPSLSAIIMARPTQSSLLYTQAIGRGTRTDPGKKNLVVVDLTDNSRLHNLASLPVLFGLSPDFDLKGKDVIETLSELEEIEKRYPNIPVQKADSLEDAKKLIEQFDIFKTQSQIDSIVSQFSRYIWVPSGEERYVLFLKNEQGFNTRLSITKNLLGRYEVGLYVQGKGNYQISSHSCLNLAFIAGDNYLKTHFPDKVRLYLQDAGWRSQGATEKQKQLLYKLNVPFSDGITKGEAQYLISTIIEQRNHLKYGAKR
jgi:ATP-dependent helicase IRC3